jgi:hypothetical protein
MKDDANSIHRREGKEVLRERFDNAVSDVPGNGAEAHGHKPGNGADAEPKRAKRAPTLRPFLPK